MSTTTPTADRSYHRYARMVTEASGPTAQRTGRLGALGAASRALNPYKAAHLSAEWRRGFNDSYGGVWQGPTSHRAHAESVAYGKGWNARRDVANVERFPLIEVPAS